MTDDSAKINDTTEEKINKSAITLGKLGGVARAAKLTPERRSEIAKQAAEKRWKNNKPA